MQSYIMIYIYKYITDFFVENDRNELSGGQNGGKEFLLPLSLHTWTAQHNCGITQQPKLEGEKKQKTKKRKSRGGITCDQRKHT